MSGCLEPPAGARVVPEATQSSRCFVSFRLTPEAGGTRIALRIFAVGLLHHDIAKASDGAVQNWVRDGLLRISDYLEGKQSSLLVNMLRTEAGRHPYDRELSDLIGELSTRSDTFRSRLAAHNVLLHRSGTKRFHHPVIGDVSFAYEVMIVAVRARRGVVRTRDGAGIAASGPKLRQPRDPLYKRMVGR